MEGGEFQLPGRLLVLEDGPHGDRGHTPRNRYLPQVKSGYVVNLDDDDQLAPHALATIRAEVKADPESFFIFRIAFPDGRLLWNDRVVREFNIGTGTFVHPAGIPLGIYTSRYGGDFDFIQTTLSANSERSLIWSKTCPYLIQPHESWKNPRFIAGHEHPGCDGRIDWQAGWHHFFGNHFSQVSLLDVGVGLGQSRNRLAEGGNQVTLHGVAPGLSVDLTLPVAEISADAFDVVTAFDVIEHVAEDRSFVEHLLPVARQAIVITTPNVLISHCGNPYHIRDTALRRCCNWRQAFPEFSTFPLLRVPARTAIIRSHSHPEKSWERCILFWQSWWWKGTGLQTPSPLNSGDAGSRSALDPNRNLLVPLRRQSRVSSPRIPVSQSH